MVHCHYFLGQDTSISLCVKATVMSDGRRIQPCLFQSASGQMWLPYYYTVCSSALSWPKYQISNWNLKRQCILSLNFQNSQLQPWLWTAHWHRQIIITAKCKENTSFFSGTDKKNSHFEPFCAFRGNDWLDLDSVPLHFSFSFFKTTHDTIQHIDVAI